MHWYLGAISSGQITGAGGDSVPSTVWSYYFRDEICFLIFRISLQDFFRSYWAIDWSVIMTLLFLRLDFLYSLEKEIDDMDSDIFFLNFFFRKVQIYRKVKEQCSEHTCVLHLDSSIVKFANLLSLSLWHVCACERDKTIYIYITHI